MIVPDLQRWTLNAPPKSRVSRNPHNIGVDIPIICVATLSTSVQYVLAHEQLRQPQLSTVRQEGS